MAATSPSDAWAVGFAIGGVHVRTLIYHWNGVSWARKPSPNPDPGGNLLYGAAAASPSRAWAVGQYGSPPRSLLLRWDSSAWKTAWAPHFGRADTLYGADAASSSDVWMVGSYGAGSFFTGSLASHCC